LSFSQDKNIINKPPDSIKGWFVVKDIKKIKDNDYKVILEKNKKQYQVITKADLLTPYVNCKKIKLNNKYFLTIKLERYYIKNSPCSINFSNAKIQYIDVTYSTPNIIGLCYEK